MTREQKLALIIGFSLVLLVGVLISDHLSGARSAQLADVGAALALSAPPPLSDPLPEDSDFTPVRPQPFIAAAHERSASEPRTLLNAPPASEAALTSTTEGASESFLRALQNQFRETSEIATPAVQLQPREIAPTPVLPEPRVADPLVRDARPAAVAQYRVQEGDSVWAIAQRHYGDGHLSKKLAEYNVAQGRMRDADTILAGATLLLPEPRVLGSNVADLRPRPQSTREAPRAADRTYTVKKGDTLGLIAQRELGTTRRMDDLLSANRSLIDDPDDIRVGMVLRLPA